MADTDASPPGPRLWRADHAGPAFDEDIAACRALVAERRGPHYLAHSTYGIQDFAVGAPDCWPGTALTEADLENAASQMHLAFVQLDTACAPLDSGPLIRLLLHGAEGAFYEYVKVPRQSFFGATFDGSAEAVRHSDRMLADLTRESVQRIGGPSLDWGGFRKPGNTGDVVAPSRPGTGAPPDAAVFSNAANAVPGTVTDLCLAALSPANLHRVGFYRQDQMIWTADVFGTPALAPFFERVDPAFRRRGYARLAHQARLQASRFGRLLALTGSERLVRLVLDVARGAVYVLPLEDDLYLVGVTLIQSQVDRTDRKLRALQADIRAAWQESGPRLVP